MEPLKKGSYKGLRVKTELEVAVLIRTVSSCGWKALVDQICWNLLASGFTVFNFVAWRLC